MHSLQLSDTPFTNPPAQNIGFIDLKYYPLVEEGFPIAEIRAREMKQESKPIFSTQFSTRSVLTPPPHHHSIFDPLPLLIIWFISCQVFVLLPSELCPWLAWCAASNLASTLKWQCETLFTRPPIENIGFINSKYFPLVYEGHPIVVIQGSEMRGLGLPLDSGYQYIPTNHLNRIRNRWLLTGCLTAVGTGWSLRWLRLWRWLRFWRALQGSCQLWPRWWWLGGRRIRPLDGLHLHHLKQAVQTGWLPVGSLGEDDQDLAEGCAPGTCTRGAVCALRPILCVGLAVRPGALGPCASAAFHVLHAQHGPSWACADTNALDIEWDQRSWAVAKKESMAYLLGNEGGGYLQLNAWGCSIAWQISKRQCRFELWSKSWATWKQQALLPGQTSWPGPRCCSLDPSPWDPEIAVTWGS